MCADAGPLADEPPVEIMGEGSGPSGWSLASSYDAGTGDYFAPAPSDAYRPLLQQIYLTYPDSTKEQFDAAWPYLWRLTNAEPRPGAGLTAILDTGVLREHPLLRASIREVVDFTGEGDEDQSGHGTMVALLTRTQLFGVQRNMFVILKCAGADGRGDQASLLAALQWIKVFNAASDVKIGQAVMSLGVYNKRFGLLDCDGTCTLCKAALEISADTLLYVAAGNTAGKTACPARAAFLPEGKNITAVARPEEATSGIGTVGLDIGAMPARLRFVKEQAT